MTDFYSKLGFGQVLALMQASQSLTTTLLFNFHDLSLPFLHLACGNLLLLFFLGIPAYCLGERMSKKQVLAVFGIAILETHGDVLNILAFQFGSSMTSFGILTSFSVPISMLFSRLIIHTSFLPYQYVGASIATVGVIFVILSDNAAGGAVFVTGDIMILLATVSSAASNVFVELFLKTSSAMSFLALLSFFSLGISTLECLFSSDIPALMRATFSPSLLLLLFAFPVLFALNTVCTTLFLNRFDSVVMNISMLTMDVWTMVFTFLFFRQSMPIVKFLGFLTTVFGLLVYNVSEVPYNGLHTDLEKSQTPDGENSPESV